MNENTRTSMENAIGEIKVSQKPEVPQKKYDKTDSLFAIIYMVLGYTFIRFFFYYDWGTNFVFALPLYTLAYIFTVVFYARAKGKEIPKESCFWIAVMLCVAFLFKIENFFRLVIRIMVAAYFTSVTGGLYAGGTSAYIWADLFHTFISAPFFHFASIFPAFFNLFKRKSRAEKGKIHPAVWGGVMAVCALWIIVPLLIRADSNFLSGATDFIDHLFASFNYDTLFSLIVNIALSTPVACYLYSLGYSNVNDTGRLFDRNELDTNRTKLRISPAITLKVFMYTVCFVYLLFILLQAEYLMGAFIGRLYSGMTYAQYARTGFFELCNVATINLSLLAISNLLIKKDKQKNIRTPMVILCVLSLLLLSTATAKMAMYISAYGLTEKRIISTVFLLWLVMVFVMCIARLYKPFNLVKTAVVTGAVMFCVLFSFDIGKHSEQFNVKYGFAEETPNPGYTSALILPDPDNVRHIKISHTKGDNYMPIESTGEIIDLLKASVPTTKPTIQDFPQADDCYTLDIHHTNGGISTVFCYKEKGKFYIEQPYNVICSSEFDWDNILSVYRQ